MVFIISDIFLLDLRVLIMDIYDVVCDIVIEDCFSIIQLSREGDRSMMYDGNMRSRN